MHISRGVSAHGFAVNVTNDLAPFTWVVACGLPSVSMTSLAQEGSPDDLPCFRKRMAFTLRADLRPPPAAVTPRRLGRRRAGRSVRWTRERGPAAHPPDALPRQPGRDGRHARCSAPTTEPFRGRKPSWFKVPLPGSPKYRELNKMIQAESLHTVCQEAACPNIGECWERGTATFMILGDTCTRRCGFCNVKTGKPTWNDPLEPARVARSVARMGLRHAVITSVDRDDLPDYGASAFVGVIRQIRRQAPGCKVEVLTPDFRGEMMPLAKVIAERPDVFNHNVEVAPRLYPVARRGSKWERSLRVLENAKEMGGDEVVTKSGPDGRARRDASRRWSTRSASCASKGVQVLTVGQYLRPTERHLPVVRYWHPDEFKALETAAYDLGFEHIAAGPLVRSSYHADEHVKQDRPGVGPVAAAG